MLHVHPDMLPRLELIETDLLTRRSRAEAEHWLGEIEDIDTTLAHLADKGQQAQRLAHTAVPLGLPTLHTTGR
jgi:hypothetical protein